MTSSAKPSQASVPSQAGFTLVELLIVLILVGLIALGLLGGLQFSYKTWDRGRSYSGHFNQVITLQELLRKQSKAVPDERALAQGTLVLEGQQDRLKMISRYPEILTQDGLNLFEFYLEGKQLLLGWQGLTEKGQRPDALGDRSEETREILNDVKNVSFSYYGFPLTGGGRKWMTRWEERSDLPDLIKMEVNFSKQKNQLKWPTLILQPLVEGANKIY